MCCIGGIGISNKNKTRLENDSPEPYIPNKFYDEWDYNDDNDKLKWRNEIKREIDNMNRREVWTPVKNFHLIKIYWIEMGF